MNDLGPLIVEAHPWSRIVLYWAFAVACGVIGGAFVAAATVQ